MAEAETDIEVTPEVLRQLLDYDPETGILTWKERGVEWFRNTENRSAQHAAKWWNGRYAGKEAFTTSCPLGYRMGKVFDRVFRVHRVAYAIMMGEWPAEQVDHIDGCPSNNRWSNLRAATRRENSRNSRCRSNSGYKGVYKRENGYFQAMILKDGKVTNLGRSRDPEELARRWDKHAKELHGEFARLNFPDG